MKTLTFGISTCPNDTFIYEGLALEQVACGIPLRFVYHDVQTLNEMVMAGELDGAKVSCGVLPRVLGSYGLLRAGGAMGYGCGPLLLSVKGKAWDPGLPTCLPGQDTTASLLFRFWCEQQGYDAPDLCYAPFDELYRGLRAGTFSQGVVIHEHRFTWERDGLFLLADLGAAWEKALQAPIPLGCAVVRRSLGHEVAGMLDLSIQASLKLAWERPDRVSPFVREKALIEDEEVMAKHIDTFVTPYSLDLGAEGGKALSTLFAVWSRAHGLPLVEKTLYA